MEEQRATVLSVECVLIVMCVESSSPSSTLKVFFKNGQTKDPVEQSCRTARQAATMTEIQKVKRPPKSSGNAATVSSMRRWHKEQTSRNYRSLVC
jgi:hypothetical protein